MPRTSSLISSRLIALQDHLRPLLDFVTHSEHARRSGDPAISDFVFGNPQEMPLPGLVEAIRHHAVPEDKNWFAYTLHNQAAAEAVAASLARAPAWRSSRTTCGSRLGRLVR